jgi:hypothetical protein
MIEINTQFYTVPVRNIVTPFYYGFGSATAKSYDSHSSDSATLNITGAAALANLGRDRGIYGTEFLRKGIALNMCCHLNIHHH